ncbi:MAG: hypothetical protein RLZZ196_1724 [Bacteroidota bacterium]|jgi:hypothetical protein
MSEIEARKYTSIRNLREEIRQDMKDLLLLNNPLEVEEHPIFCHYYIAHDEYSYFEDYLVDQIHANLSKLKELVEQNNE